MLANACHALGRNTSWHVVRRPLSSQAGLEGSGTKELSRVMPAMLQGAAAHGPCILVHPLEAVQEVEMAGGSSAAGGWDEEERVVW